MDDNRPLQRWRTVVRLITLLCGLAARTIAITAALSIVSGLIPVVQIIVLRKFVDSAVGVAGRHVHLSLPLSWLFLITLVYIAGTSTASLAEWYSTTAEQQLKTSLQNELVRKACRIPLQILEQPIYNDLLYRAEQSVNNQVFGVLAGLLRLPTMIITVVSLLGYVATVSYSLAFVLVLGSAVVALTRSKFINKRYVLSRSQTGEERRVWYFESLMKSRAAAAELRLFGIADVLIKRRREAVLRLQDEQICLARREAIVGALATSGQSMTLVMAILGIATLIRHGELSAGQFLTYVAAVEGFQASLHTLLSAIAHVDGDCRSIDDLFELLSIDERKSPTGKLPAPDAAAVALPPKICFEQVSFSYPNSSSRALSKISFVIEPGETLAVVGANGSGKTTLSKLLLGLYAPAGGRLTVDGVELEDVDADLWFKRCAAIFQDYARYHLTVHENIGLGDPQRIDDMAGIRQAAATAGIDRIIDDLPQAYDTTLGAGYDSTGTDLSVGQWQRMATARAYFRDASVLVLDEPTASLDAKAEAALYRRFQEISRGRSVVLISHRLGSARLADRILVLDKGQIAEMGTHDELINVCGVYATMWRLQAQWYAN